MDPLDRAHPDPRRLLADYRDRDRMPAATREAAWQRLQAAVHRSEPPGPAEQAPERPAPPPRHARRVFTVLLAAAALALLFAGLGQLLGPRLHAERDTQALHVARDPLVTPATTPSGTPHLARERTPGDPAARPAAADPPDDPAGPESHPGESPDFSGDPSAPGDESPYFSHAPDQASPAPAPILDTAKPAPGPARRPRGAHDPAPLHDPARGLDAELSLLRRARTALAESPQQALQLLAEHARRFPAGHLAEERMLLRVQALCAVGEPERARAAARKFARAHPESPHIPTIAAACE